MKFTVLLLVSFFFFILTYFSTPGEFSSKDLIFIAIIFCVVTFAQFLLLKISSSKVIVQNLLFSIFVLFNVYCLHLVLVPELINMGPVQLSGLAILGLFILFTLAKIIEETKIGGFCILFVGLTACTGVMASSYFQSVVNSEKKRIYIF